MSFVHLHVHTEYSVDAMSNIRGLFERASRLKMPALAITDHGTIAGVPEFLKTAEKYPEVKPIAGCEFWLSDPAEEKSYHLILLAKNLGGYRNLIKLCNFANSEGKIPGDTRPYITPWSLAECHDGLICTSACIAGEIPQMILSGDISGAIDAARWYKSIFGDDFYLEVSLHKNFGPMKLASCDNRAAYKKNNRKLVRQQQKSNEAIFDIARELDIKVVATNDIHFASREDGIAHDVMLAEQWNRRIDNPGRRRYSHLEYMKSEEEMRRLFPEHPEVIENTMEVAEKVERYSIWGIAGQAGNDETVGNDNIPCSSKNPDVDLRKAVFAGAEDRFAVVFSELKPRLEEELSVIAEKGCAAYFLMMKEITDWIRSHGWVCAMGPGRGSASGSLVNYCLGITDVDPMKHNLLFERFLNRGQVSMPSIDLDMEQIARDRIVGFLKEKYGEECVAEIEAAEVFGEYRAKNYDVKKLGKGEEADDVARRLSHVKYGSHIHYCSVLVSPKPLKEILPMNNGISEYGAKWTDEIGVLRLNFLSLRTLKVLEDIVLAIEEKYGVLYEPQYLPLDDKETFELFAKGDTVGIFQFEPEGMREWLRQLQPDCFSDLVAIEALYWPGSIEKIPDFVDRKKGRVPVDFMMPELGPVLEETYGVPVYQEQQMQICELVAGFTPEMADQFRKASTKKKMQLLTKLHEDFLKGGQRNGHEIEELEAVWEFMDQWYPFNKSHAVSYTLVAYWMAWFKANYPEEFYVALLNNNMDLEDDLVRYTQDGRNHKVCVLPPDKTQSGLYELIL